MKRKFILFRNNENIREMIFLQNEDSNDLILKFLNENYGNHKDNERNTLFEQKKKPIMNGPEVIKALQSLKDSEVVDVFYYSNAENIRGWKYAHISKILDGSVKVV